MAPAHIPVFLSQKPSTKNGILQSQMETGTAGHFDKEFGKWFGVYDGHNGSEVCCPSAPLLIHAHTLVASLPV